MAEAELDVIWDRNESYTYTYVFGVLNRSLFAPPRSLVSCCVRFKSPLSPLLSFLSKASSGSKSHPSSHKIPRPPRVPSVSFNRASDLELDRFREATKPEKRTIFARRDDLIFLPFSSFNFRVLSLNSATSVGCLDCSGERGSGPNCSWDV